MSEEKVDYVAGDQVDQLAGEWAQGVRIVANAPPRWLANGSLCLVGRLAFGVTATGETVIAARLGEDGKLDRFDRVMGNKPSGRLRSRR
jgi:hypothetical protein